jgi:heparin/heparan-sulfate lyase
MLVIDPNWGDKMMYFSIRLLLAVTIVTAAAAQDWKSRIRDDHPRLFFNEGSWPAVKARAVGEESATFKDMRSRVDELVATQIDIDDYGTQAAESAFVFLVTGNRDYLRLTKKLLATSIGHYHKCYADQKSVNWYSFSRINAWAAYDWIFDYLSEDERKEMGQAFLRAVEQVQPTRERKSFPRENWLGPISGFYGTPGLLWYAGLATYGEGINDELAESFLTKGYSLYIRLLEHRSFAASDDGGSASGALNYALAAYPWAEFNFFHTFKSATGVDIAADWPYVAYLPAYIFWNWLPGGREFGYGDAYHTTNQIRVRSLNLHLSQIVQFYAESLPECGEFAKWFLDQVPREEHSSFPFSRFLLTAMPDVKAAENPAARMPMARHFERMGQTFMRSGSGPDDTYALFTAGGVLEMHKQYDHNNFVIYKKGFLALDTGTRPQPGLHLSHYYCRTVAHNCVLIRMPNEKMPRYWGERAPEEEDLPFPNDGGQREVLGSRVVAFETHPDYSYVAGDATDTYSKEKCRLALRQFLFLPPDFFVIFDRVVSTQADYPKTWLLHSASEPRLRGDEFRCEYEGGRLYGRTLLPEEPRLKKIGGPGKQFWSDGRNWPLPKGYQTPDELPLLGQWRVEVSPGEKSKTDFFLHLIQVGEKGASNTVRSERISEQRQVGLHFESGSNRWRILFGTAGTPSGNVTRWIDGKEVFSRDLTNTVMPQTGLYGENP